MIITTAGYCSSPRGIRLSGRSGRRLLPTVSRAQAAAFRVPPLSSSVSPR